MMENCNMFTCRSLWWFEKLGFILICRHKHWRPGAWVYWSCTWVCVSCLSQMFKQCTNSPEVRMPTTFKQPNHQDKQNNLPSRFLFIKCCSVVGVLSQPNKKGRINKCRYFLCALSPVSRGSDSVWRRSRDVAFPGITFKFQLWVFYFKIQWASQGSNAQPQMLHAALGHQGSYLMRHTWASFLRVL